MCRFGIGERKDRENGDGDADVDRDSAPPWKRFFVDSAVISLWVVNCTVFESEHSDQRGESPGDQKGDESREKRKPKSSPELGGFLGYTKESV